MADPGHFALGTYCPIRIDSAGRPIVLWHGTLTQGPITGASRLENATWVPLSGGPPPVSPTANLDFVLGANDLLLVPREALGAQGGRGRWSSGGRRRRRVGGCRSFDSGGRRPRRSGGATRPRGWGGGAFGVRREGPGRRRHRSRSRGAKREAPGRRRSAAGHWGLGHQREAPPANGCIRLTERRAATALLVHQLAWIRPEDVDGWTFAPRRGLRLRARA